MATVDKNFRVKHGLVVEGSTGTINGENILTENASDQYIINLIGGTATDENTPNAVVKRDGNGDFSAGVVTADLIGNVTGNADTATTLETARTIELTGDVTGSVSFNGSQNVQIQATVDGSFATDAEVATAKSEAISDAAADATTKANAAQAAAELTASNALSSAVADLEALISDAESFATTAANNAQSAAELTASNALSSAVADLEALISDAEGNANNYTNTIIESLDLANTYDALGAANAALSDANAYTDQKVADLVDSAPEFLDTLNELAAAIAENPNYASDVANLVATKADTSYVDSEISDLDIAAQGYASTAQDNAISAASNALSSAVADLEALISDAESNANVYTNNRIDNLDTDNVAEGSNLYFTDSRARDAVDGTDRSFTSVELNSVAKQIAATTGNITPAAATTAFSWAKADFRSGKFTVKVKNGSHTELSEILVTLDTSDNVSITEYGIVGTNGSLSTITADVSGNDVRIRVTPVNDNSEVMVAGTLL